MTAISSIAFAHHKGGTGKTTSCLNIAGFLQKSDERVLVVDCDPQANATSGLGIDPSSQEKNIYDVFMSIFEGFPDVPITDVIMKTPSGIDLIPSSLDLVGVEPFLYNIDRREEVLQELLKPVCHSYDHVLIDTPPSMGQFVINGIVAADKTIITLDGGMFALRGIDGLAAIFQDIEEMVGKPVIADLAILTQWKQANGSASLGDRIMNLIQQILQPESSQIRAHEAERLEQIERNVRNIFADVYTVPYDSTVHEAQRHGMPLSHYAPGCDAAGVYQSIAGVVETW